MERNIVTRKSDKRPIVCGTDFSAVASEAVEHCGGDGETANGAGRFCGPPSQCKLSSRYFWRAPGWRSECPNRNENPRARNARHFAIAAKRKFARSAKVQT
jgi:hypothetical protein